MGFHHVYDNANIAECKWMISEIETHIRFLEADARDILRRNARRARRRRKDPNAEVSDDEPENSDCEEVSSQSSGEDAEDEDEDEGMDENADKDGDMGENDGMGMNKDDAEKENKNQKT